MGCIFVCIFLGLFMKVLLRGWSVEEPGLGFLFVERYVVLLLIGTDNTDLYIILSRLLDCRIVSKWYE